MKIRQSLLIASFSIGLGFWLYLGRPKAQDIHGRGNESLGSSTQAEEKTARNEGPRKGNVSARSQRQPQSEFDHQKAIRSIIDSADERDQFAFLSAVQKLREQDPEAVGQFFLNELQRSHDPAALSRHRLVVLGESVQSKHLLPFWTDIIERQTPMYDNEKEILASPEPSEAALALRGELSSSLRALAGLSRESPLAKSRLENVASGLSEPTAQSLEHRSQAFTFILESDKNAGLRVLKGLRADDPLRDALREIL